METSVYYDNSEDQTTETQLNIDIETGYIFAPTCNTGEISCWDENFQDIACSEI